MRWQWSYCSLALCHRYIFSFWNVTHMIGSTPLCYVMLKLNQHYMTSQWARCRLKSPVFRLFAEPSVQVQFKENIKAPCYWPLWGDSIGDRWIPLAKDQYSGKYLYLMTLSWETGNFHSSKTSVKLTPLWTRFGQHARFPLTSFRITVGPWS